MADTKSLGDQGLQKYTQYIRTLANATYQPLGDYATTADLSKYATTAQVLNNIVDGQSSSALHQISSTATGQYAVALGKETKASGDYSFTIGEKTLAGTIYDNNSSKYTKQTYAQGYGSTANGWQAHAEGQNTFAGSLNSNNVGSAAHAEGYATSAVQGNGTHSQGVQTLARYNGAHAEGHSTLAASTAAHAEGYQTTALGRYSHAEGYGTSVSDTGTAAHTEGLLSIANGLYSHAEGYDTEANDYASHAEGNQSIANGLSSHAEGRETTAFGNYSHAQGYGTVAQGQGQTVIGQYNVAQGSTTSHTAGDHAFIIGNGTANNARSNAMSVTWNGAINAAALFTTGDVDANGYVNATGGLFYDSTDILQLIYPIGAIYMSTKNTLPAALVSFGTWTQIKDVFLLAAGDTYTAGDTGGQATITYTPAGSNGATALSIAQMPSHYHYIVRSANSQGSSTASQLSADNYISAYATAAKTDLTYSLRHHNSAPNVGRSSSQGSGSTHNHTWTGTQATLNNMPPYKVVYAWERTA